MRLTPAMDECNQSATLPGLMEVKTASTTPRGAARGRCWTQPPPSQWPCAAGVAARIGRYLTIPGGEAVLINLKVKSHPPHLPGVDVGLA